MPRSTSSSVGRGRYPYLVILRLSMDETLLHHLHRRKSAQPPCPRLHPARRLEVLRRSSLFPHAPEVGAPARTYRTGCARVWDTRTRTFFCPACIKTSHTMPEPLCDPAYFLFPCAQHFCSLTHDLTLCSVSRRLPKLTIMKQRAHLNTCCFTNAQRRTTPPAATPPPSPTSTTSLRSRTTPSTRRTS